MERPYVSSPAARATSSTRRANTHLTCVMIGELMADRLLGP
jgi:hypothetical protein